MKISTVRLRQLILEELKIREASRTTISFNDLYEKVSELIEELKTALHASRSSDEDYDYFKGVAAGDDLVDLLVDSLDDLPGEVSSHMIQLENGFELIADRIHHDEMPKSRHFEPALRSLEAILILLEDEITGD